MRLDPLFHSWYGFLPFFLVKVFHKFFKEKTCFIDALCFLFHEFLHLPLLFLLSHFLKLYSAVFFSWLLELPAWLIFSTFLIFQRFWAPFKYHVSCISHVLMPYWTPTRCFRLSWPFSSCCQHFCQHHLPEQASRLENAGAAHSVNHSRGVTALLQHSVVSTSHGVSQIQEKGE